MYNLITKLVVLPLSTLFAQVGGTPDNIGVFIIVLVTLLLLGGSTFYFINHKRKTIPFHHGGWSDSSQHDEVI